jgi:dTMP kinase
VTFGLPRFFILYSGLVYGFDLDNITALMTSVNPARRGLFIVFEGGEGTGKTTQIKQLEAKIRATGREVLLSWEPGGTALGERIRAVLLDPSSGPMSSKCEALLYAAARAEHVEKVLRPALDRGAVVLCDRYWDASRAYQGVARKLGISSVDQLNYWATGGLFPDRVLLFDINPEIGLSRAAERQGGMKDRLEQESLGFHETVRAAYRFIAESHPESYEIIDASRDIESIGAHLWKQVQALL